MGVQLGVDELQSIKRVFDEGELDIDEFVEKLGPYLGGNLSVSEVQQLFMKIDADAGGTIDWDEFTNYMFLQRQEGEDHDGEDWRFFPQDFRDRNDTSAFHRDVVTTIFHCKEVDKYVTCGRDGTFRVWNASDLKHNRTVTNGSSWVCGCCFLPSARKLVFTAIDRSISYYDINRGAYDLVGRVYTSGSMGIPSALSYVKVEEAERVVYGDTKGGVVMLFNGFRELPGRDLIYTEEHQDYMYLHQEHTDWVTKIESIHDVGLVTSSLDSTIKIMDISRGKVLHSCRHHTLGVHCFAWCRAYSIFASCGLERDITLWQGNTGRRMGELSGHTASVLDLAIDDQTNQVVSLAMDRVIKVWDLRNNKCLQTITQEDWANRHDSNPRCLAYDGVHRRMLTAVNRPYVWPHKLISQDRTGHKGPVVGACYNEAFKIVCSLDEAGTAIVWRLQDGARQSRFFDAHPGSRCTCLSFDTNRRRLITAANDGSIKMWNFNNGSVLRQYMHSLEPLEITAVLDTIDEKRESSAVYACGWNSKIFVWEDQEEAVCDQYRTLEGHREDILCMVSYLPRHLLATGDYEGRVNVFDLHSGERKQSMFHRADRYENGVEQLQFVEVRDEDALLLLSSGLDGVVRVWRVGAMGQMVAVLRMAVGRMDHVSALSCNADYTVLAAGDTSGHISLYDLSQLRIDSPQACRESLRCTAHWKAHSSSITGVELCGELPWVTSCSKDARVALWTLEGGLVGVFGTDAWDLDDPSTFADRQFAEQHPPDDEAQQMVALVKAEMEEEGGASASCEEQQCSESEKYGLWEGIQPAQQVLQLRRERREERANQKPYQLHGLLHLHGITDVPGSVRELLRRRPNDKRRGHSRGRSSQGAASTHSRKSGNSAGR